MSVESGIDEDGVTRRVAVSRKGVPLADDAALLGVLRAYLGAILVEARKIRFGLETYLGQDFPDPDA